MGISRTLERFLRSEGVSFDLAPHPRTMSSAATAEAADIAGMKLAKAVIVEDTQRYFAVVIPSTLHVDLGAVRAKLGRQCGLATEPEIARLFPDCELGAVPAVAQAFGLGVLVDRNLFAQEEIYSQSGDHGLLIRLRNADFAALMRGEPVGELGAAWTGDASQSTGRA